VSSGRAKGSRKAPAKRRATKKKASPAAAPPLGQREMDGRFHLALVVDPASGRERLDLMRPVFVEDWQNRLTAAAANTAYAILRDQRSVASAARLGKAAMDSTSTLVGGLLARAPAGSVACQSGCAHCCYQSVGVTPPEAMAIALHLRETRSAEDLARVRSKVGTFAERVRGLSSDQRVSPSLPCPLLEGEQCSIYEVRPLSCRGVNSLDAETCRQNLHDPEARAASVAGKAPGHLLIAPIRAFNAISAGLQLALAERFGLDMRPLDLAFALELLLADENAQERWLAGQPALTSALGGDAGQDPGRLELVGAARREPLA